MIENRNLGQLFTPRGQAKADAELASTQVAKAARDQVLATSEVNMSTIRLEAATRALRDAELDYFTAVEKSSSDSERLRAVYNNALAGYRDADRAAEAANSALADANSYLAGISKKAGSEWKKPWEDDTDDSTEDTDDTSESEDSSVEKSRVSASDFVSKRAFSDEKREKLADKGHALPDGSFPIETKKDVENAVKSYGLSKDPEAAKAHIISRAKDLGCEDCLPEGWTKKVSKASEDMMVLCPCCMGDPDSCDCEGGCDCEDGMCDPDDEFGIAKSADGSVFSTGSLLTRTHESDPGFIAYSVAKGDVEGHVFHGNQYSGGGSGLGGKTAQADSASRTSTRDDLPKVGSEYRPSKAQADKAMSEIRAGRSTAANHRVLSRYHAMEGIIAREGLPNTREVAAQDPHSVASSLHNNAAVAIELGRSTAARTAAKAIAASEALGVGKMGQADSSTKRQVPVKDKDAAQPVDPDYNPARDGALINMPKRGVQMGFKKLMREYEGNIKVHTDVATKLEAESKKAADKGDLETAANKMDEAAKAWERAAGAAKSVHVMHEKYAGQIKDANPKDPHVLELRQQARDIRDNQKARAEDLATKLTELANKDLTDKLSRSDAASKLFSGK